MGQAIKIRKLFKVSDPFMLQEAQKRKDIFETDKAIFIAFDSGTFNNPFSANMQTKINDARNMLDDDIIRDQIQQTTAEVKAAMEECRVYFQNGKYFVDKAFPGNKEVQYEFGYENYDKARKDQKLMFSFMDMLYLIIEKYRPNLLAAGATAAMLNQALVLRDKIFAKNQAQEFAKSQRPTKTRDRIIKHNDVWKDVVKICKAGKVIFRTDYVKYQQYLLPASEEHHTSYSIMGTIKSLITDPLEHAEISIVELGINTNSDDKGKYGFGAIPTGIYTLKFQKIGYVSQTINNVQITEGETKTLNIILIPVID